MSTGNRYGIVAVNTGVKPSFSRAGKCRQVTGTE